MCGRAAGVHHPLGDPFVVEVGDLLPQVVVLQQHRAPRAGLEGMVGVGKAVALGGGKKGARLSHPDPVPAGGLAGAAHGLRRVLVRLGRQRAAHLGGLLHCRGLRRRLARNRVVDVSGLRRGGFALTHTGHVLSPSAQYGAASWALHEIA